MLGTAFEPQAWKFDKWSKVLYEERWKYVVSFCKSLEPLLPILQNAWDMDKYQRALHREDRQVVGDAQQKQ